MQIGYWARSVLVLAVASILGAGAGCGDDTAGPRSDAGDGSDGGACPELVDPVASPGDPIDGDTWDTYARETLATYCTRCHGTLAWRPSTFTHRFPRTGDHNVSCAECHRDPTNVAVFSCTHCHAHRQSEMADKHSGVGGYAWVSASCYQCHPNGRG